MMTSSTSTQDFVTYIRTRLDRLDDQAAEIRQSALKMVVFLTVGLDEARRRRCLEACIAQGLLTSPIGSLDQDVERIVAADLLEADRDR